MSKEYDKYLEQHRNAVKDAYYWIKENLPEILPSAPVDRYFMEKAIEEHDRSKDSTEEYQAYDDYFYGEKPSKKIDESFNQAWLHHIHANPHHWQYWILRNDEPGPDKFLKIPHVTMIEMICDWWSFGWTSGNLTSIQKWYNGHKNHIKMNPESRAFIETAIQLIINKVRS